MGQVCGFCTPCLQYVIVFPRSPTITHKVRRSRDFDAQSRMPAVPTLHGTGRCRTKLSPVGSLPMCISVGCSRIRVDSHSEPEKKEGKRREFPLFVRLYVSMDFLFVQFDPFKLLVFPFAQQSLVFPWISCKFSMFSCHRFFYFCTSVYIYALLDLSSQDASASPFIPQGPLPSLPTSRPAPQPPTHRSISTLPTSSSFARLQDVLRFVKCFPLMTTS
jgi:hypothetical protein